MTATTEPLSGRALDAQVAERVLGHEVVWRNEVPWKATREGRWASSTILPFYSGSLDDAHQVEERIAELGLCSEYGRAVASQFPSGASSFDLLHASPLQRCRAALAAVEGAKGE